KLKSAQSLNAVKQELLDCANALEKVRFLAAGRFTDCIKKNEYVLNALPQFAETAISHADDCMIVHAAGLAYAQASEWDTARKLLEPIAWVNGPPAKPGYLPVGDVWLAAMYHDRMERARKESSPAAPDSFIRALLDTTDDVLKKAELIRDEIDHSTSAG